MKNLCLQCQGSGHRMNECRRVDYRKGNCCLTCGFPQKCFDEVIHGDIRTGECEEGLMDLIKGVCWRIFRDGKLNSKYLEGLGDEVGDKEKYRLWLARMDTSGEMTNGCRLMLNIWRERQ